jgi:hypothetical protein
MEKITIHSDAPIAEMLNAVSNLIRLGLSSPELHNLYASTNIIKTIKLRMMRWAYHVARNAYDILVGKLEGKVMNLRVP